MRCLRSTGKLDSEFYVGALWGCDPQHERHAEMIAWRGKGFDPTTVDEADIREELAKLAQRWTRRKIKTPPQSS